MHPADQQHQKVTCGHLCPGAWLEWHALSWPGHGCWWLVMQHIPCAACGYKGSQNDAQRRRCASFLSLFLSFSFLLAFCPCFFRSAFFRLPVFWLARLSADDCCCHAVSLQQLHMHQSSTCMTGICTMQFTLGVAQLPSCWCTESGHQKKERCGRRGTHMSRLSWQVMPMHPPPYKTYTCPVHAMKSLAMWCQ